MNELKIERAHLSKTIIDYNQVLDYYKLKINSLGSNYRDNAFLFARMHYMYENKIRIINKTILKPYFARIDFLENGEEEMQVCYIGKVGVSDCDDEIITVDWRAPIASVYYDSNIGGASYIVEDNIINGNLSLKRQYEIENGILQHYTDVDSVSNDDILKPYLMASADNRLKNIVASIQGEQNKIIREKLYKNLIVQGVAGSGKTTVALHRIAYLVYNHMKTINPNQYLVVGPNKFFVNYISGILPDLDVENVGQMTYFELCASFLKENLILLSDEDKLKEQLSEYSNENDLNYKLSLRYKKAIDEYLLLFNSKIIENKDFEIMGYQILSYQQIKKIYDEIENEYLNYNNFYAKVQRAILLISKYIMQNSGHILAKIKQKNSSISLTDIKKIEQKLLSGCRVELKTYFKNSRPNVLKFYIEFLKHNKFNNWEKNVFNITKKCVEFEDLAPLIYLQYKIYGSGTFEEMRHVVIDEAQDYGDFNFLALKEMMPSATFSIFGDLAQSIYEYRSIDSWQSVVDNVFYNNCDILYLLKSYRTTTEIMNEANKVTKYLDLDPAIPVIRHGVDVKYLKIDKYREQLIKVIDNYLENKYKTIAIICKDEEEAKSLNELLASDNINLITDKDTMYNGGICIIPSYLAKGLEFDAVIISNASSIVYNINKVIDMKLLYVSMTRALHELTILYENDLLQALK